MNYKLSYVSKRFYIIQSMKKKKEKKLLLFIIIRYIIHGQNMFLMKLYVGNKPLVVHAIFQ